MPPRRVHLGLDYGTSAAKMVVRDYGAPGGEQAHVVLRPDASFRFPSGVAAGAGYLWFGQSPADLIRLGVGREMRLYESVKMRCAVEMAPETAVLYLPPEPVPYDLRWVDLATVTVWWLISEGYRFARTLLDEGDELVFGMTMGAPTSFVRDPALKAGFLRIARAAWTLFKRKGALADPFMTACRACREVSEAGGFLDASLPPSNEQTRDWLRSEAEGALWWAFQSPNVAEGPFLKVDVGAGTTNVSLFRIVSEHLDGRWVNSRICFFSAVSGTEGMDAIDAALAAAAGSDPVALRGHEDEMALENGDAAVACAGVIKSIVRTTGRAWKAAEAKIGLQGPERDAWNRDSRAFLLGGGGDFKPLRDRVRYNNFAQHLMPIQVLEQPGDLRVGAERSLGGPSVAHVGVRSFRDWPGDTRGR